MTASRCTTSSASPTIAPGHGIVYVPCHRSHVDYLLLSYIIFTPRPDPAAHRRRRQPQHAGGRPILRRGGAFFLRRKLQGRAALCRGFPRIPAPDDRPRLPHRILHRGRSQPQRAHAGAQGRHPRDDGAKLRAQPGAAAGLRAGVHRLRKADGGQEPSPSCTAGRRNPSRCSAWSARRACCGATSARCTSISARRWRWRSSSTRQHPAWREEAFDTQAPWLRARRRCDGHAAGAQHQCPCGGQPGEPVAVHAQACGRPAPAGKTDRARPGTARRAALGRLDHPLRNFLPSR
jgi:hypothetical protein